MWNFENVAHHIHFLIHLPEDIDSLVSAEIPDAVSPLIADIVTKFMLQNPCRDTFNACMMENAPRSFQRISLSTPSG